MTLHRTSDKLIPEPMLPQPIEVYMCHPASLSKERIDMYLKYISLDIKCFIHYLPVSINM